MWKVYDDDNNDDEGQWTNFDQKSSLEPWAQVSLKWPELREFGQNVLFCHTLVASMYDMNQSLRQASYQVPNSSLFPV